ncbi:hypothetical protein EV126DRAFT_342652 [Verticillium dahliae]|nr:hypothetical protein EV126DRAFT_342765 [Verticillium dahliae]KAH6699623.1 hypothetical protein EV126DRAFT_342652 [Verticillium dahliae]
MTERFEDSAPDVASKQRRIRRTAADIAKNKRTDAAAIAEFALNHRIKENRRSSDPSHTKRLARHISQLRYAQTDGIAELPLAAVVDLTRSFTPSEWMAIENSPDQFRRAMEFYRNEVLELDATWMTYYRNLDPRCARLCLLEVVLDAWKGDVSAILADMVKVSNKTSFDQVRVEGHDDSSQSTSIQATSHAGASGSDRLIQVRQDIATAEGIQEDQDDQDNREDHAANAQRDIVNRADALCRQTQQGSLLQPKATSGPDDVMNHAAVQVASNHDEYREDVEQATADNLRRELAMRAMAQGDPPSSRAQLAKRLRETTNHSIRHLHRSALHGIDTIGDYEFKIKVNRYTGLGIVQRYCLPILIRGFE